MSTRIDPLISASHGTLAGDLLWDYWLHLSHHHGDDRLSEPALFSLQARSLAQ